MYINYRRIFFKEQL